MATVFAALGAAITAVGTAHAGGATGVTATVDAVIEPAQIGVGESAQLTVTASGSGTLEVPMPVVPGLEFRVVGQSRRIEMINGATIASTSTIIRVTAEEAGVFTIPGLTPNSPPLVLRVNPSGSAGTTPPPDNPASPRNPLLPGGSEQNGIRLSPDGSTFVRLEVPKHDVYVGESVPAEIQVGMRDGFAMSINGLPKLNSSDFTLNSLSQQPEQSLKLIDGKQFTVYTWRSVLAAIKPGSYSLEFSAPVTVRIRTQPRRDSLLDDMLGDPFMQSMFGSFVTKNITVNSPAAPFTVLALPAEGRPADFSGAVGSFKVSSDVSSTTNTAGDPLTLRLHVAGTGSFDRVDSSMLPSEPPWKTYQPKATFNKGDPTGFHGEKVFEQPIIASQPGSQTIPPLSFSYFDPMERRYETVRSAPLQVTVTPSAADGATPTPTVASAAVPNGRQPVNGQPDSAPPGDGMRPDHAMSTVRTVSLPPLYLHPLFLGCESALALLFGVGWIAMHRRERIAHDERRQRERRQREALDGLLGQMAVAAAAGDAAPYFNSARAALRQVSGVDELDDRFAAESDDVKQIFSLADEANYSGVKLKAADFERWTRAVHERIDREQSA
jgi:hypothetical protein